MKPWKVTEAGPGGGGQLHVLPVFEGERTHEASVLCWCNPRPDAKDPRLWIHHRRAEA
jgi:hypothetical protein